MIVDLFAGPGGWDEGLAMLGRRDVVGVEWDESACLTAGAVPSPHPDEMTRPKERTMSDQIQPVRRTIRRYAHELYPHGNEGETRDLAVEVPYLYARAIGLDVWGTSWNDRGIERAHARTQELIAARHIAFLADALLQGLAGQEAWEWADQRAWDETGEWAYDRASHYGVPVAQIKPYACGPEPDHHDHMASTGDVTGYGRVARVDCPESECPTCTEESWPSVALIERPKAGA